MNLTLIICYTQIKFLTEYSSNFNFIVSFQYREIYVVVLATLFEWDSSNFSCLCRAHTILTLCKCHANGQISSKSLNVMQRIESCHAFLTKPFKCSLTSQNGVLANHSNVDFKRLVPNRATHHIFKAAEVKKN